MTSGDVRKLDSYSRIRAAFESAREHLRPVTAPPPVEPEGLAGYAAAVARRARARRIAVKTVLMTRGR